MLVQPFLGRQISSLSSRTIASRSPNVLGSSHSILCFSFPARPQMPHIRQAPQSPRPGSNPPIHPYLERQRRRNGACQSVAPPIHCRLSLPVLETLSEYLPIASRSVITRVSIKKAS